MDHDDTALTQSLSKRQLRYLVVSAPAAHDPNRRIDVIHEPDLGPVQGAQ